MADQVVGEAFVRIRPLVTPGGFAAESEGAVAAAGTRLGTVFAAAFAAVGVATLVKSVVGAAVDHQAAFAVLARTVQDAGASNTLYGQSLESLLSQEARLKGFTDEELASAFQRLVSVTHDSSAAFKDLQAAEDLARFRHIDLATAALAISKAVQGSTTALQRYGLVVPKVTQAEDALKLSRDQAVAAGAKITAGDKLLYEQRLQQAKAADKLATEEEALQIIQQRTGGTAATFADTAAGQFARLGVDLHQFKVAVGTDLLPLLTGAAEGLGAFLQKASQSPGVMHEAQTAAHDVGEAFHVTGDIVKTVGPILLDVTDKFGGVTRTVELLGAALIASKAASWLAGIGAAETAAAAGTAAQTAALTAFTVALEANTAALATNDAAVVGSTTIYDAYGGTLATVATAQTAEDIAGVGGAAATAGAEVGGLRGALAGLAGLGPFTIPITIAIGYEITKGLQDAAGRSLPVRGADVVSHIEGLFSTGFPGLGAVSTAIQDVIHATGPQKGGPQPGVVSDAVQAALFPSLGGGTSTAALAGVTGPPLATEFAAAAAKAAKDTRLIEAGKNAVNTMIQGIAAAKNDLAQAYLNNQQNALNQAGDQISLWYDTQSAKLLSRSQALTRQQSELSLEQQLLSQAQAKKSLADLRHEVLLPGGHALPANNQAALRELNALERRDKSPALQDFILQFRGAILGVKQGALGIDQGKLGLQQEALDQIKQREQSGNKELNPFCKGKRK